MRRPWQAGLACLHGIPIRSRATTWRAFERLAFDDGQIFAVTAFVALRLAFATVNDALGAAPDHELNESLSDEVRSAVSFGRSPDVVAEQEVSRRCRPQVILKASSHVPT